MYFEYGETEIEYLKQKDKKLAEVIDTLGMIERTVDMDLFSSVVHHIIGQQISTKAQATIWQRMQDDLGVIDAETILEAGIPKLQAYGMTFRKAEYLTDFAEKIRSGAFDLNAVWQMSDQEAIEALSSLNGIGVWTAEMILLFCMQRPDVFSYGDLAILRGFVWCIITEKLIKSCLKSIADDFHRTAVWQVCICGLCQEVLFRV